MLVCWNDITLLKAQFSIVIHAVAKQQKKKNKQPQRIFVSLSIRTNLDAAGTFNI